MFYQTNDEVAKITNQRKAINAAADHTMRGLPRDSDIDHSFLLQLGYTQQGKCAVTGKEFDTSNPYSIILGLINPTKGYTKSNVRWESTSWRV